VNHWTPASKVAEMIQRKMQMEEQMPVDPSIAQCVVLCGNFEKDGAHGMVIYASEPDKMKELIDLLSRRYLFLANCIDGFKYSIDTYYSEEELVSLFTGS
jgi:hypothetical protein